MSPLDSCHHLLLLAMLAIIIVTPLARAIKCWDCNSKINPDCSDPFKSDDFALADCSQKVLARFPDRTGHFCRKTIQKVNDEYRTIRGCGYINDTFDTIPPGAQIETQCTRRSGTFSVLIEYCACNSQDGCNHAATLSSTAFSYLLPLAIATIALMWAR